MDHVSEIILKKDQLEAEIWPLFFSKHTSHPFQKAILPYDHY